MTNASRACACAALLALSACSGGGGSGIPTAGGATKSLQSVAATIRITVPNAAGTVNAKLRKRYSVAWNTAGINVTAYASPKSSHPTALAQSAFDVSTTSASCSATATGRTCTFSLTLPGPGTDDFITTSYDAAPVNGTIPVTAHQLGVGIATAVTVANGANPLSFTIDGVVASATILPLSATFPALSNGTIPVNVQALDADGSTIVADNYVDASGNPVTIALSLGTLTTLTARRFGGSASTLFSISPQSIDAPAPNGVTLTYTASGLTSPQFNGGFALTLIATPSTGAAATATLTMPASNTLFTGMNANAVPNGIALGPDNNLWFTEGGTANAIGTMLPGGTYLGDISIPTGSANPQGITTGSDGNLWFTEAVGQNIGVVDPSSRAVTGEFAVPPAGKFAANPFGIAAGPDGNLWFTECLGSQIASINPTTHTITAYPTLSSNAAPLDIVAGPDGNLWFTETAADNIGKITTGGTVTEYPVPTSGASPSGIVVGPDGALWFTEASNGAVGRITTSGVIAEYPVGSAGSTDTLAVGGDGNLWVSINGFLARVTPSGTATVYSNTTSDAITGMIEGADGNVYYLVDDGGANNAIGFIQL